MASNLTILKQKKYFKLPPNLPSYEKAVKSFKKWSDFEGQLSFFKDHKINAAYNAIDKHIQTFRKNKVALYFESESGEKKEFSYYDLFLLSNKACNVFKDLGLEKNDRAFIFLPRIPQLFYCFLGIQKVGAVAGTLFSAFGPQALEDRLGDSQAKIIITNNELKERVEKIRHKLPNLKHVISVDNHDFIKRMEKAKDSTHVAHMEPDDYAFMLYTSGTTGKPKGVVHSHKAILMQHLTAKWVLDLHDQDTYWCTADPGWVTGIAYEILGSWSNGVTSVVYEGRFDAKKWYEILEKYAVSVWYTAPTAIRMLMAAGDDLVKNYNLSNLRHLCSVGEPLNPACVLWSQKVFGLPFHDNWWQTETGGILIANYPSMNIKPGSMGKPIPGIKAAIFDDNGEKVPFKKEGNLAIKPNWPSLMKTIWRKPKKYRSYFFFERNTNQKWYLSGDRAWQDKDGYFWFVGRADDVIKTSGERVGPFEVESALVAHPSVIEAGVIGKPDPMRGEIIKAFVVLEKSHEEKIKKSGEEKKLIEELQAFVKKRLAGHAYPREIEFIDKLPKTRSGKIMRRILKAKELGLPIGDTSTLEEY
ncbi:MAG: acetate--CoA ligase [Candidatus Levybacteria bacterium RBG_16_35_11]|nr:MAG: acetate--CoA ligase [Candidatus Levybacteria bacterium RBG_16_35_11]